MAVRAWLVALAGCSFHANGTGDDGGLPGDGRDAPGDGTVELGRCAPLPMPASMVAVADVSSFRAALASATPGTTIALADGHYDLSLTGIVLTTPGVTIRSASNDASKVVLDGGFGTPVVVQASDVTLASLTVGGADNGVTVAPPFSGGITHDLIYDVTFAGDRAGMQLLPFAAVAGPFADQGTIACSRFVAGSDTCTAGTLGIVGLAVRGWVVRDNRFDHLACGSGFRRTVVFYQGSRDTQIVGNVFLGGAGNVMLGQDASGVPRQYSDAPTCTGGVPEHRDGVVCNNRILGLDVPSVGGADFQEGVALWNACNPWVLHNTVVSPDAGETFTNVEFRYQDTNAHIVNNLSLLTPTLRDSATADFLSSDVAYSSTTDFVDAHQDLHLTATASETSGASLAGIAGLEMCASDADGKPRDLAQPIVGAYER